MLCQRCHKNLATVRYAEVVDGKVSEQQMCSECMARRQAEAISGFELSGEAPAPRARSAGAGMSDTTVPQRTCRSCGIELQDVVPTGRVGCPVCYESFSDQLESILRGLQFGSRHRGKAPRRDDARERLRADLQTKRALLRSALKTESYEDAARLRDAIRGAEDALRLAERKPQGEGTSVSHA
ncbi:MAG: hypothetical protein IT364_04680 [Candidatus Hydrogenedentes bacterium]|nr:hypothetical protein [Candidatus Hydrogenedentota bacterium]